jgi:hypothetical protein
MLRTEHARAGKPGADFESFGRRNRQHRLREFGFHPLKHRLAQPRWHMFNHAGQHTADRIFAVAGGGHEFNHLLRHGFVGTTNNIGINLLARWRLCAQVTRINIADGTDPRRDLGSKLLLEPLFGNSASGHTTDGFARAGTTAAAGGAVSIFHLIRKVGVRRPRHITHFAVVARALVLVVHHQTNGGSQRFSYFHAGKNHRAAWSYRSAQAGGGRAAAEYPPRATPD